MSNVAPKNSPMPCPTMDIVIIMASSILKRSMHNGWLLMKNAGIRYTLGKIRIKKLCSELTDSIMNHDAMRL
jgi:hypothetical protein